MYYLPAYVLHSKFKDVKLLNSRGRKAVYNRLPSRILAYWQEMHSVDGHSLYGPFSNVMHFWVGYSKLVIEPTVSHQKYCRSRNLSTAWCTYYEQIEHLWKCWHCPHQTVELSQSELCSQILSLLLYVTWLKYQCQVTVVNATAVQNVTVMITW